MSHEIESYVAQKGVNAWHGLVMKMSIGEVAARTGIDRYLDRYANTPIQKLNATRGVAAIVAKATHVPLRTDRLTGLQASLIARNGKINPVTLKVRKGKYQVRQDKGIVVLRYSADRG